MKKALSGVLAASLALSSFASVAFAAEATPKTAEEMFKILAEKKIFDGYEDGSMGLDKTMTRAEVTKVLVKLLNLSENKAGASVYTDLAGAGWAEGYIGAATKAGIMDGVADGKFDPSGKFTTEQLAAVLVRALKLPLSTEAAEGVVADWAKAYVATAVKAGLVAKTADYTTPALRSVLVASAFVADQKLKPTPVQAVEAKIVGAKKVEVKFAAAVADTTKADIAVKRGTSTVVVENISWNDAKTVATIEFASKLLAGEHVVTVKGATDAELTSKVTAEAEKVAKIEILNTSASLTTGDNAGNPVPNGAVQVGYKVSNQYGEDITKITTLEANSTGGAVGLANGTVTIDAAAAGTFTLDQKVTLTLIHTDTAVVATQTLTVSSQSKAANVTVDSLYHAEGKTLKTTSTANEYMLVVNAVDQYGQKISSANRLGAELLVTVTNPAVVSVNGLNNNRATFETVTIKGEEKTVLKLAAPNNGLTAGETVVTLISESTGKSVTFNVKVEAGTKANTITFGEVAQTVAANETVNLPVTVTDVEGNELTDVAVLNGGSSARGVSITGVSGNFVKVDGQLVFQFNSGNAAGTITLTALTANTKTALKTITVKAAAVPTTIIGVDADTKTAVLNGNTLSTSLAALKVEDQYGRLMSDAALNTALTQTVDGNGNLVDGVYRISVSEASAANTSAVTLTDEDNNTNGVQAYLHAADTSVALTGQAKGTESLTFVIEKYALANTAWAPVAGSSKTISYRTVDESEVVKYGVDAIAKIYTQTALDTDYNKTVSVYGETSDGKKVTIPAANFIVLSKLSGLTATGAVLNATQASIGYASGVSEVTGQVEVVINATGESILADVAVSKSNPTATTLELRDSNNNAQATITHSIAGNNTLFNYTDLVAGRSIYVKDQYGVVALSVGNGGLVTYKDDQVLDAQNNNAVIHAVTTEQARLTITGVTNASGAAPVIANNGTATAQISGLDNADSFTVVITVGGKSTSVKVNVTP